MGKSKTSGGGAAERLPSAALRAVHELFVAGQVDTAYLDSTPLRRVVAESWQRSLAKGVDPDRGGAQASAIADSVARMRTTHPLAATLPVIRRLLVEDATDSGVVVAVTAADGTLLWVEGDRRACRRAEAMNFVPGADWSERGAGTNAPGTALALDSELQIRGSEHFSRIVQPWSCTAVPVHDPDTGALLGAIDLTGGSQVASPQTLALVRATVVAVENQLALLRLTGSSPESSAPAAAHLVVLGADRPRWQVTDEHGQLRSSHAHRAARRHPGAVEPASRGAQRRSPGHVARRQGPRRRDHPRRNVAAAPGHRGRIHRITAVPAAGTHHQRRRRGLRRAGMPGTSTPRCRDTPGRCCRSRCRRRSPGCGPS